MEKKPIFLETQRDVSTTFYNNFVKASTETSIVCGACGRIHFFERPNIEDDADGLELQNLFTNQEKDPDSFISHNDAIPWFLFGEKEIVIDCNCHFDVMVEDGLKNRAESILGYLEQALSQKQSKSNQTDQLLKKTKELTTGL